MSRMLNPVWVLQQASGRDWWRWCLVGLLSSGLVPDLMGPVSTRMLGGSLAVMAAEAVTRPTLKTGSSGIDVRELQSTLRLLGFYSGSVDGVYGETTAIAVSRFQQAAGLPPDGIAGPATWNRLFPPSPVVQGTQSPPATSTARPAPVTGSSASTKPPSSTARPAPVTGQPPAGNRPASPKPPATATTPIATPEVATFPVLRLGMKGPAVTGLQHRLQAIGVLKGAADGVFGPETQEAVKAAQRKFNLTPDGVVGPATWVSLLQ